MPQDEDFEVKAPAAETAATQKRFPEQAGGTLFWLEERYEEQLLPFKKPSVLCSVQDALAAWEADGQTGNFWSEEDENPLQMSHRNCEPPQDFRWAMANVWSRCCRIDLKDSGGKGKPFGPELLCRSWQCSLLLRHWQGFAGC